MAGNKSSAATATIIVAVISAAAAILVGYWQYGKTAAPAGTESTYAGHVRDSGSEQPIRNAKVTLEIHGAPPVVYTDSEGVYSFKLTLKSGEAVEGRIRVVAEGYENFDRNISISATTRLEDVRLTPVKKRAADSPHDSGGGPTHKLAVAVGVAVAMLGGSSHEVGRTVFERSLSDLGVPPSQVRDLTDEYRALDRSMSTAAGRASRVAAAEEKHVLHAAAEQVRVLGGEQAAQHVDFGYGLCRLTMRLSFWASAPDPVKVLSAARAELSGIQRRSGGVEIPQPLHRRINGLRQVDLDSAAGREAVSRVLTDTLKYFDVVQGPPAATKGNNGKG